MLHILVQSGVFIPVRRANMQCLGGGEDVFRLYVVRHGPNFGNAGCCQYHGANTGCL
jgi:hypothetical protein